jgi:hypothetical protein
MKRFNFDDEEVFENDPSEDDGPTGDEQVLTPEEYKALIDEEQEFQRAQIILVNRDLNHRLLGRVIKMLEKSFWWKFYSLKKRLDMIDLTYNRLLSLEGYEEIVEEDDK